MKKLLLALTLIVSGSMSFLQAMPVEKHVPIVEQNRLNEQAPQRWKALTSVERAKIYTALALLAPLAVGGVASALFAPEPVTKGLETVFGPLYLYLENKTKY